MFLASFFLSNLFFSQTGYAEERKDEWVNKNYELSKVKRILIKELVVTEGISLETFDEIRIREFHAEIPNHEKLNVGKLVLIKEQDLLTDIGKLANEDMKVLFKSDPIKYKKILDLYTPILVDQVLEFQLVAFGTDQFYVPESSRSKIEYIDTMVVTKKKGSEEEERTTVRMPVERIEILPAHYKSVVNSGIKAVLRDAKTDENILMILDIRESDYKGLLPMTGRIFERMGDRLGKILNNK